MSICIVLRAFRFVVVLYVSLGPRVIPSILGLIFIGSVVLFICRAICVLYSAGSGMKRVHVEFDKVIVSAGLC